MIQDSQKSRDLCVHRGQLLENEYKEEGNRSCPWERSDLCFTGSFYNCLLKTEDSESCRGMGYRLWSRKPTSYNNLQVCLQFEDHLPFAYILPCSLLFLFLHLLSQATQLWPVSLTICSCSFILLYQCQLFFISSAFITHCRSFFLFLFILFFLHLVNIPLFSGFFRYKYVLKASQCYLLVYGKHAGNANSLSVPNALQALLAGGCRGQCDHHNLMPGPVLLSPSSPLHLQIVNACSKCWNNFNYLMLHELISGIMGDKMVQ